MTEKHNGSGSRLLRVALLAGAAAAAGAGSALSVVFARRVLTPSARPDAGVIVVAIEELAGVEGRQRVWLRGTDAALNGSYSFIFDADSREAQREAGHARLGPVVARSRHDGSVARDVLRVERGELREGTRGRITGWWFSGPRDLGHPYSLVNVSTPRGSAPAWAFRPDGADARHWAVHVHGRGALPEETLRGVEPFARAGVNSLVISYRNDPEAPSGIRGRYGLGLAEAEDVSAAIDWASRQGATRITLVGWSMGGTACVLAAAGENAHLVDSMVLDSPALDWPLVLKQQAHLAHLPRRIAAVASALMRGGLVGGAVPGTRKTDLSAITARQLARSLTVPTLIHASPGDTFVPWSGALRVASLRPRLVRLHPGRGEHVKLWNEDPEGWEAETESFIAQLRDPRSA